MAQPSSSHRERERGERSERSSRHHHHRTISSTTLLLVLSLVLAVLAVMLSLPSSSSSSSTPTSGGDGQHGFWGAFTPKRTQAIIARESAVATREAEVARREAELLAGAPGGVLPPPPPAQPTISCPVCPTIVEKITEAPIPLPIQTVIKEVVKEESLTPPGWWDQARVRAEDILDRELKIAEREREISRREEAVNRREHDASRRESWIMEQIVAINNEEPTVEEEIIFEPPVTPKGRKPKVQQPYQQPFQALPPPFIITETAIEVATEVLTVTHTQHHTETLPTKTVTVPAPANTRKVASPAPQYVGPSSSTTQIPRTTTVVEVVEEVMEAPSPASAADLLDDDFEDDDFMRPVRVQSGRRRQPKGWFSW